MASDAVERETIHISVSLRQHAALARRRVRLPRLRIRRFTQHRWKRVVRKLPFLVDPVTMTLLPWAWPKHPALTRTP